MDSQSIITQASRDESCTEFPILSLPRPIPPAHHSQGGVVTSGVSVQVSGGTERTKKSKRGSRLLKLFCCFGRGWTRKPGSGGCSGRRLLLCSGSSSSSPSQPSPDELLIQRNRQSYLLPSVRPRDVGKKCVVIDLDETLVHSSFKPVYNADFVIPVEIEGTVHQVYVLKRPYVDEFLQKMGEMFECVLFTASLAKYADPVADLIDKCGVFRARLFRDSCIFYRGNFVKDLSQLGRDLRQVVIIDNSPASYVLHPDNAVAVTSWFDDEADTELMDLLPLFETIADADNVYSVLHKTSQRHTVGGGVSSPMRPIHFRSDRSVMSPFSQPR